MEKSDFLNKIFNESIPKIPFLDLLKGHQEIEDRLYDSNINEKQSIYNLEIIDSLFKIDKLIKHFKNEVLMDNHLDVKEHSRIFTNDLIYKLDSLDSVKLKVIILKAILQKTDKVSH